MGLESWNTWVSEKAEKIIDDYWCKSNGEVSLEDALVGIYAKHTRRQEFPRVLVHSSEDMQQVFSRIFNMIKTPTYHTVNYQHPSQVKLAAELCCEYSITGQLIRDARYVMREIYDDAAMVYWDQSRDLPQYGTEIIENLKMQFGEIDVAIAIAERPELATMLGKISRVANTWLGGVTESYGLQNIFNSSMYLVNGCASYMNQNRIPYRKAQYALRGIPISIGIKHDH